MKCYFELCIYQKDNTCTLNLECMEINNLGMCEHCEIISLDNDFLSMAKQKRLAEISKKWTGTDDA